MVSLARLTQGDIGESGDGLLREIESMVDGFVARLRREALTPAVATLKRTQLADHCASLLADIASALVTLDESGGTPSSLLSDGGSPAAHLRTATVRSARALGGQRMPCGGSRRSWRTKWRP